MMKSPDHHLKPCPARHQEPIVSTNLEFLSFLEKVFNTINPSAKFINNWHIQLLAEYLKTIEDGKIKRLIVNIPPRSLKSICISVAWPAWILGKDPTKRIIVASYSHSLAVKHSLDTRDVIQSDWYKQMFPHTIIPKGKNTQRKFCTSEHGFRYATSVGGTLTGEGADLIIMDDPQTPIQASNCKSRQRVNDWYDQTLLSRLNNRKQGVIILVMQRLHQQDLSQHLLNKNIFHHLKIPITQEKNHKYEVNNLSYNMVAGSMLHGYSSEDLKSLRTEMGSFAYNAQYLQAPLAIDSSLFKASWIKRYHTIPEEGKIVQSWDCAAKAGINNDYSVCTTWKIVNNNFYLIDVLREKLDYVNLRHLTISCADNYQPDAILIEDKASGQQLVQELSSTLPQAIIPINPKNDKISRTLAVSPIFEAGRVHLPINQHWLAAYEAELFSFPGGSHDDQIDATTQLITWANKRASEYSIRRL